MFANAETSGSDNNPLVPSSKYSISGPWILRRAQERQAGGESIKNDQSNTTRHKEDVRHRNKPGFFFRKAWAHEMYPWNILNSCLNVFLLQTSSNYDQMRLWHPKLDLLDASRRKGRPLTLLSMPQNISTEAVEDMPKASRSESRCSGETNPTCLRN